MLHDPRLKATPSQRKYMMEHIARVEKIAACAKVSEPIAINDAPIIEPKNDLAEWIERQDRINPIPKDPWFTIEEIDQNDLRPKIVDIQHFVAKFYEITRTELVSIGRNSHLVRARQVGMYLCKKLTVRSMPEIGRRFGNRDHTTVLHAIRKIDALVKQMPELATDVETLQKSIMRSIG